MAIRSSSFLNQRPFQMPTQRPLACRHPEQCTHKAELIQRHMQKTLPAAFVDYEKLLEDHTFYVTEHADQRMEERHISLRGVYEVLEAYNPIECWQNERRHAQCASLDQHPFQILVTGESEIARRPLCIVCGYGERSATGKWSLHILTVYDPSTRPHKWTKDYTRRICFCKDEQTQPLMGAQTKRGPYEDVRHILSAASSVVYSTY